MTPLENDMLTLLKKNARYSIKELANFTQSTEKKVSAAITNLEKKKIILQYTAIIDEEKVDHPEATIRALIEIRVQPEKKKGFDRIAASICKHKNVVDHFLLSGSYDFLIIVEGSNLKDISSFVSNKLAPIDHVSSTTTHFILKKYKENGVLIGEPETITRLPVTP
jgi:DNA-binding Lrp family transcriptional regulator